MVPCEMLRIRLSDRYESFARLWLPSNARGAVLYLHGIQSHGLWFEASAARLAEAGLAVLLPDRRGSGRNGSDRGHAPSARRLLRDVAEYMDELHVRTGFARCHLVGVSWGGKLAAAAWPSCRPRIASLTLVAPGLFPQVDLTLRQKLRVAMCVVFGRRARFIIPLSDPELFTANPARIEFIRSDPLALHQVTTALLLASRRLDQLARNLSAYRNDCPLRLFLAGQDRIINNHPTREFVRRLAWPRRDITEYPDAHHTLEFEPDPRPFMNDLAEWIVACSNAHDQPREETLVAASARKAI